MSDLFRETGAARIRQPSIIAALLLFAVVASAGIALKGLVFGVMLVVLPAGIFALIHIFRDSRAGLFYAFAFAFLANGIPRYAGDMVPFGLFVDAILLLGLVSLLLSRGKFRNWSPVKNDLVLMSLVWMGYTLVQLFNPEAVSFVAWFYAMRGVAFYQILLIPLGLMVVRDRSDLRLFLIIWFGFSLLASLKGIQQIVIGTDPFETKWLDGGGGLTHRIQGRLRAFSFYSDAGVFGAAMGQTALVAGLMAFGKLKSYLKWILLMLAAICFAGMLYSGTRGALAVPAAGGMLYLFLSRNFKVFAVGMILGLAVFGILRFTFIGNTSYQIYRLRTAVRPALDASFQVRLENQRRLKTYLADKPFGGGIGSAGNWGMRFSPNTFLAQTPTDSWYVRIWAEMGIIGLSLHLFILFYLLARCSIIVWKLKDPELRNILVALVSGIFGIMVASYGNGLYGQMPINVVILMSYVLIYRAPHWKPANVSS